MSDNTFWAIVITAIVGGCTITSVADSFKTPENPQTACVKRALLQSDRIQCLQASPK